MNIRLIIKITLLLGYFNRYFCIIYVYYYLRSVFECNHENGWKYFKSRCLAKKKKKE